MMPSTGSSVPSRPRQANPALGRRGRHCVPPRVVPSGPGPRGRLGAGDGDQAQGRCSRRRLTVVVADARAFDGAEQDVLAPALFGQTNLKRRGPPLLHRQLAHHPADLCDQGRVGIGGGHGTASLERAAAVSNRPGNRPGAGAPDQRPDGRRRRPCTGVRREPRHGGDQPMALLRVEEAADRGVDGRGRRAFDPVAEAGVRASAARAGWSSSDGASIGRKAVGSRAATASWKTL